MRRGLLALALALLFAVPLRAQSIVVLTDPVRARLARDWDKHAKNPLQHERAYCVQFRSAPFAGGRAYLVNAISAARVVRATSDRIVFYCDAGPGRAALHVHPPTTCKSETNCRFGGPEAYECFASPLDVRQLTQSVDEFGLIQCDRKAVVFFFPDQK